MLPAWKDFPGLWDDALREQGGDPADFPFWMLTARSMQYAWGGNVGMQLIREVAQNVAGHRGVIVNGATARRLGIADGDEIELATPHRSTRGSAVIREGIRPDTLLAIGQFDHWATPYAKDFGLASLNTLASMSLGLTTAGQATANVAGGFAAGGIAGGNMQSAVIGALSAGLNFGIGEATGHSFMFSEMATEKFAANVAAHAALGCAQQAAAGGSCGGGAAAAGFSALAGPLPGVRESGVAGHAAIGAIASRVAGGKAEQGAVTAAMILAEAAYYQGYKGVTAAPFFGAERRGAPIIATNRFGREPVRTFSLVEYPDIVVYIERLQPRVVAAAVDLDLDDGSTLPLIRDGRYVVQF